MPYIFVRHWHESLAMEAIDSAGCVMAPLQRCLPIAERGGQELRGISVPRWGIFEALHDLVVTHHLGQIGDSGARALARLRCPCPTLGPRVCSVPDAHCRAGGSSGASACRPLMACDIRVIRIATSNQSRIGSPNGRNSPCACRTVSPPSQRNVVGRAGNTQWSSALHHSYRVFMHWHRPEVRTRERLARQEEDRRGSGKKSGNPR